MRFCKAPGTKGHSVTGQIENRTEESYATQKVPKEDKCPEKDKVSTEEATRKRMGRKQEGYGEAQ